LQQGRWHERRDTGRTMGRFARAYAWRGPAKRSAVSVPEDVWSLRGIGTLATAASLRRARSRYPRLTRTGRQRSMRGTRTHALHRGQFSTYPGIPPLLVRVNRGRSVRFLTNRALASIGHLFVFCSDLILRPRSIFL